MPKSIRFLKPLVLLSLAGLSILASCSPPIPTGYKTYSLPDKGIAHLSFEYPAAFYVRLVQLLDDTGFERMDIDGPYSRQNRDRTTMWVAAQRYPTPTTVGDMIQNAISAASGLSGYRQIERSTTNVNGMPAEQHTYFFYSTRSDYEIKVLGLKPSPMVTREVFFTYNGLQWTVGVSADERTVDADTPGFEHLLQTLTMLP
ncbi:MAG: hypothetical protein C4542_01415 [Dehalococcoidia bacterium]|nr:MAG: hypothetical protein C4542_01415 [Dehalococcoidia bacterium]